MTQYKLEGIKKCYGKRTVLEIPEFSIEPGQIYTIVGPNGAGKTTLLNLLAFLDVPSQGKILFNDIPVPESRLWRGSRPKGRRLWRASPVWAGGSPIRAAPVRAAGRALTKLRQKVTLVMQAHLLFDMSVYANVAYGLKKRGYAQTAIQNRVNQALRLVGLTDLAGQSARTLSGGEGKRLAIARAIAIEPEVLILDEPTANIDRRNIESIERLVLEIHREKHTTIICSTHNLNQAYRLGQKVISLVDGKLVKTPMENIFYGELHADKTPPYGGAGLKWMEVAPGVKIWLDTDKEGKHHIAIDPRNIILSKTHLESSARNSFRGKIVKTLLEESRGVKVYVDIGVEFITFITKNSFEEMGLRLGEEIFLTFKSSSVTVL